MDDNKGKQIEKEIKVCIFTDNMVLWTKDSKTWKVMDEKYNFCKVWEYKISKQKSVDFTYITDMVQKAIREAMTFTMALKYIWFCDNSNQES